MIVVIGTFKYQPLVQVQIRRGRSGWDVMLAGPKSVRIRPVPLFRALSFDMPFREIQEKTRAMMAAKNVGSLGEVDWVANP